MAKTPSIIQYTNLLHEHKTPYAQPVKDFVKQHKNDKVFMRRVETLNRLWVLKNIV